MPAKTTTYMKWLKRRVSQTNSRCKHRGVAGKLDAEKLAERFAEKLLCHWCLEEITDPRRLSLDHLKALSAGGANVNDNIVLTHRACNLLRSDWAAEDWQKFVGLLRENGFWLAFKKRYKPRRFRR